MSNNTLNIEKIQNTAVIKINRPEKLNALNKAVIDDLHLAVKEVETDNEIFGAIITGVGEKAFVAGADISEFLNLNTEQGAELARYGQEKVFNAIEGCLKPIVAAVNGFALGGGCELAMACHFRTASTHAKFGQPEVNLGLIPGYGGTQRLIQIIGKGKALELMMTAAMIGADEAKTLGLVNHIFEPESLIDETLKILNTIYSKGPEAIGKIIQSMHAFYKSSNNGFNEEIRLFGECFGSEEMKEGVSAFLEKRKPNFRK